MSLRGVKVGDTLYIEQCRLGTRSMRDVQDTVAKVGRKWVYDASGDRFDIDTGWEDRGQFTPISRAYRTMEEIMERRRKARIVRLLRVLVGSVTEDKIDDVDAFEGALIVLFGQKAVADAMAAYEGKP